MYKKFVFAVVLLTTMALVSCKNENLIDSDEDSTSMMMNMEDGEARLDKHLEMVDLETPFGINHKNQEDCNMEEKANKRQERAEKMKGMIKEKLGLSDEQVEQMKSAKDAMKECSESAKTELKILLDSEFEEANAKRDVIISSLKNNEITNEEAKELLKTLKGEVKESIKSNSEIISLKEELKACHDEMKTKMESILTADQLEKMKEMKGKHRKGHRKGKK